MKLATATLVILALSLGSFLATQPALAAQDISDNSDCSLVGEFTYSVRGTPFERTFSEPWIVPCPGLAFSIFSTSVTVTQRVVPVEDRRRSDYAVIQPDGTLVPCPSTDVLLGTREEIVSESRTYPELPDSVIECMSDYGLCCYERSSFTTSTYRLEDPVVSIQTVTLPCPDEGSIRVVTTTSVTNETVHTYKTTHWRSTGACPADPCQSTMTLVDVEIREYARHETTSYPDGLCGS